MTLKSTPTVAPLTNVALTLAALQHAAKRDHGLPGLLVLYGPSGWGKSTAAAYSAVAYTDPTGRTDARGCYYLAVKSVWSRKDFLIATAKEMGLPPKGGLGDLVGLIAEQLVLSGRPLIIDEADELAERPGGAGLIKDLYESTQGTILLIGEEGLPDKLRRYERLHGRVLEWIGAQAATRHDARALTRIYCPGVEIADDLIGVLADKAGGSVRRIAVNLDTLRTEATKQGWQKVDIALWGDRPIYTGQAPARRVGK